MDSTSEIIPMEKYTTNHNNSAIAATLATTANSIITTPTSSDNVTNDGSDRDTNIYVIPPVSLTPFQFSSSPSAGIPIQPSPDDRILRFSDIFRQKSIPVYGRRLPPSYEGRGTALRFHPYLPSTHQQQQQQQQQQLQLSSIDVNSVGGRNSGPIQTRVVPSRTKVSKINVTQMSDDGNQIIFHSYIQPNNKSGDGSSSTNGSSNSGNGSNSNSTKNCNGLLAKRFLILDFYDGNSVHKCFDVKTKIEYVCKTFNVTCPDLLTAHFRLDGHPHINPLQKVIQTSKQTHLLFNPSQGDLHSYVRVRKRLREAEARRLFRQMCTTVKSCHEQGIVLRDLKLRKFVFADHDKTSLRLESLEDAVVLTDRDNDLLQDKRGCPAYVSPEILKVNATYSGKSADMWSLGVILYTMLVGRYPFNDSEHATLFAKISRGHFTIPDSIATTAKCMIKSLLRREPEERITSQDVLDHPWLLKDDNNTTSDIYHRSSSGDHCVPDMCINDVNDEQFLK